MPTERLAMRHVRDVIRLKSAGMPVREIARRVGAAPSTVRLTIRRVEAATSCSVEKAVDASGVVQREIWPVGV